MGAYALAVLAGVPDPQRLSDHGFNDASRRMTDDAVRAALGGDTKVPAGFWLKCSLSLFPNSPMNHPSNGKKSVGAIRDAVERWRAKPEEQGWPGVPCVLCGRDAVRFFGKLDVPLAESDAYRNNTPRGHDGMALCWPCVSSFRALPYGCQLTGGPSIAVHSWDERFLAYSVRRQVRGNRALIDLGREPRQPPSREVLALQRLRGYGQRLDAGVELIVFSNNNRGQTLEAYALDQPLAEWLRSTLTGGLRQGSFWPLLKAHRRSSQAGIVNLARNVFRNPQRVVSTCGRYLASAAVTGNLRPDTGGLATLCYSYSAEVLDMDDSALKEIQGTAARVATLLAAQDSAGKVRAFHADFKQPTRLRSWLRKQAVWWMLQPPDTADSSTPLVTTRGYELLFDPDLDSKAWFHREVFLIAVLEELHRRRWRPSDAAEVAAELAEADDDPDPVDRGFMDGSDDEDEEGQR
ncbi:hypothetical protein [Solwaraspora sp. WMMD792]|uniref:hypothetical protein n=1 Tax=Solwaraspora sp. WMMD792 TaxID=3016099 RepID=UPI002415BFB4|nr:hypothetical protein [Solwaraspora sp. WMMD792]MDG4773594.1 hypothetical protein [Solwaraspora sp. WMMD792]